jgi:hypothetical protein
MSSWHTLITFKYKWSTSHKYPSQISRSTMTVERQPAPVY